MKVMARQGNMNRKSGRNTDGTFASGNRFWQEREHHGAPRKFADPEQLRAACIAYFDWANENPLYEDKLITHQGAATHEPVARMRAFTLGGLCVFLGISHEAWKDWRKNRSDLSAVIGWVETVIFTQKFEGAAANLLNANIISRELGLANRQELTGQDGLPIQTADFSEFEIARRIAFMLTSAVNTQNEQADT